MPAPPLVSCVMPTYNRQRFLRHALRFFVRQTYPNKELIVVDDGDVPAAKLCEGVPGVKYLRLDTWTPLGTKLNIGIQAASGAIIQKVDDDDYYGPEFVASSVARLPRKPSAGTLVTRCCFLALLRGDAAPRHSGHGWTAGGGFCFWRVMWDRLHFRAASSGADSWFLYDHRPRVRRICRTEDYMVLRHGANTWTRMTTGDTDDYFRSRPLYPKKLSEIVRPEDLPFYRRFTLSP